MCLHVYFIADMPIFFYSSYRHIVDDDAHEIFVIMQ